jgi:hypothetical protein
VDLALRLSPGVRGILPHKIDDRGSVDQTLGRNPIPRAEDENSRRNECSRIEWVVACNYKS